MAPRRTESWFLIALLLIAISFVWLMFTPYMSVFVLAGTLAFLFRPLYLKLLAAVRYESLAAFLSVLVVTLIVFLPLVFFGQRIFAEATAFYASLVSRSGFDFMTSLGDFLHRYITHVPAPQIVASLNQYVQQVLAWIIQNLAQFFSGIVQLFFLFILTLLGLFYFFKDGARMKAWLVETLPLSPEYTEDILREIGAVESSVVKGTLIVALVYGIVLGIGFLFFNIPNPLFWAAIVVLASIVPVIGPWLVLLPAIAYLLFTTQTLLAVGLALWSLVFTNIIASVLAPQLMRRGLDIHPYLILLSILGGIGFFGPVGFLTGPLVVAFLVSLLSIYRKVNTQK